MTAKESCKKDHQRLFLTFALHFYNLKKFQNKVSFCFKKPMLSSFKCIINCNNTRCGVSCIVCASVFPGPHSTSEIQLWLRSSIHSHNQISAFFPQIWVDGILNHGRVTYFPILSTSFQEETCCWGLLSFST